MSDNPPWVEKSDYSTYVRLEQQSNWAYSEDPHPRVCLDFNSEGRLIGVEIFHVE